MKKDLSYYMKLDYPFTLSKDSDDEKVYFVAEITDLPGCGAQGETIEKALKSLEEAKKLWIEVSLEKGLEIPEPVSEVDFSGKYLLRIPPKLHMLLTQSAKKEGLSLNQYLRKTLEEALSIENILERMETIERELKQIREKIEGSVVTYVTTSGEETYQSAWKGSSSPGNSFGGLADAAGMIEMLKNT